MKISETSLNILQYYYDKIVLNQNIDNFTATIGSELITKELHISYNDFHKCMLYLRDKRYLSFIGDDTSAVTVTTFGIDTIEMRLAQPNTEN